MKRHKVLYITYDGVLEPVVQSQVTSYIKGLSKRGFEIFLLSFEKRHNLRQADSVSNMISELRNNGITWYRLPYHAHPKVLSTFLDALVGFIFASFVVYKKKIGIIHARAEVPAAISLPLSRIFKTKFIFDRRGIMAHDYIEGGMWPRNSLFTKIIFGLVNNLDKKFVLFSDYVVVLTRRIEQILKNDFSGQKKDLKIQVIPCCVDLDRFRPGTTSSAEKFLLMYAGSLGTWYMLNEMLDFFIELKKEKKNAQLLIATLSDHNFVKEAILRKNISSHEFTLVAKDYRDMHSFIASADAAIMFIKPVYSKIASCPTKFAECLACGLPIIINSRIGDTQELISQNRVGVVIDGFAQGHYRRAVEDLLALKADSGLAHRCRSVAQKNFSLEYGVEKYLEVYRNLS